MGLTEDMLAEKRRFLPDEGFNLVGVDDFEPLGEQLYLIGNFPTRERAEEERRKRAMDPAVDEMFIYGPIEPK